MYFTHRICQKQVILDIGDFFVSEKVDNSVKECKGILSTLHLGTSYIKTRLSFALVIRIASVGRA